MRFAADATLGKLVRRLRSVGFDTVRCGQRDVLAFYDANSPDRVILTRTKLVQARFSDRVLVFVRDDDPQHQFLQVLKDLNIAFEDLRPFSRCLECNLVLYRVDKAAIVGKVPIYVWQRHHEFFRCDGCQRIFWAGSHRLRMQARLETVFNSKENSDHER